MRTKTIALATLMSLLLFGTTANSQVDCTIPANECSPPVTVPEPGTLLLFATGIAGLALARRRKKQ